MLLDRLAEDTLRTPLLIAVTLTILGLLLYLVPRLIRKGKPA